MVALGAWHRLEQALPAAQLVMAMAFVHAVDGTV